MKKLLLAASLSTLPLSTAWAQPELYGRANVSFELVDDAEHTGTELRSNSSRLGLQGSELVSEQLEVVYQLEYGVDFDDEDTFSQRNIFVGVQNEIWGRVIAGRFDTPFKRAQGKIDLFNDLRGDIGKTVSIHENRESNSVMYTTPSQSSPFAADFAYISSESDERSDGQSAAVSYQQNDLYAAFAIDQDVEEQDADAARLVAVYSQDMWQVGGMAEWSDTDSRGSDSGWLVSGLYKLDNQWALKAQLGISSIREEGGQSLSIGTDYKLSKTLKTFAFYTTSDADARDADHYLGAGVELRF